MELKDAVLMAIAEVQDDLQAIAQNVVAQEPSAATTQERPTFTAAKPQNTSSNEEYIQFLGALRERILVLYEGILAIEESGDQKALQKKVEMVVNFLEFVLAGVEDKLESEPKPS